MPTPLPPDTGHFATDDSEQMIKLLELEIINRRAKRLAQGGDDRRAVRTLGIFIIFIMLMAVLGMTWYMQASRLAGRPAHPHETASPAEPGR